MILDGRRSESWKIDGGEIKEPPMENNKKSKNVRRKRMELRRIREKTDPAVSGETHFYLKKKRPDISTDTVGNDVGSTVGIKISHGNDVGSPAGGEKHGKVSVIGRRREMEDAVAVELGFLKRGGRSYDFYGVYDGHGGWRVANACGDMLHKLCVDVVGGEGGGEEIDWKEVMVAVFDKMDKEVNKHGAEVATVGSTAVVAVVGEEEVVVANCGDSRAVLCSGGVAMQVSDDHKPDRPDELKRIEVSGGKVINWNGQRILGVLATSRSIGDEYLKPFVITEPEVRVIERDDTDEFLILASDGLWDVVSNDLACQVTRRCLNGHMKSSSRFSKLQGNENNEDQDKSGEMLSSAGESKADQAAAVLAELAMARGSWDNISVIVVELQR